MPSSKIASAATAVSFDALESRQMQSASPTPSAAPSDTVDYHVSLNDDGTVVQTESAASNPRTSLPNFAWFDGSHYNQLAGQSGGTITDALCQGSVIWPSIGNPSTTRDNEPNEANVRQATRDIVNFGAKLVVIDNEMWRFDIRYYTRQEIDHTVQRMTQIFQWMHDEAPTLKIGLYGYMSQSDDNNSVLWNEAISQVVQGSAWYQASLPTYANSFAGWQACSEYLRPLSKYVDYVFPALYTGTTSIDGWENSAKITIEDSRRYGKPVIPFLMPFYHPATPGDLGGTELPTEMWNRELSFVQQYADGAFIWTPGEVDNTSAWFNTLMEHTNPTASRPQNIASELTSVTNDANGDATRDRDSLFSDLQIDGIATSIL